MPRRILTNGEGRPIVALDIDGTLGNYHAHFIWFAEQYLGYRLPDAYEINPGQKFSRYLGLSQRAYREVKLAYRQGGLKRFMPCYPGAAEMSTRLRQAGADVWICTTRPYLRLDNIDPDTQHWLARNQIAFDGLLYGEDKYQELKRQVGPRVAGILEDLPELLETADRLFPDAWVIRRVQPYNITFARVGEGPGETLPYAEHLNEATGILLDAVSTWKGRQ